MTELTELPIATVNPAAEGLVSLCVDVRHTPLAEAHHFAGQYGRLAVAGFEPKFFAIASAPGERVDCYEFLVKRGAPLGDALSRCAPGDAALVSAPMGKGFPLDEGKGRNVLFVATGSGLSPVRSAIQVVRRNRRAFGSVTCIVGAKNPRAFAYEDEFEAWKRDGVDLVLTISEPAPGGWPGRTGYVQSHLSALNTQPEVAFLCGQSQMVQRASEVLVEGGVAPHRIYLNY